MRTNDLFLTAAAASMMMLAACTHDDGTTSISEPTPVGNELIISTRHSEMGITRAESNIQSSKFDLNAEIDVFLKDASGVTDSTLYAPNPKLYKVTDATTGAIKTYSEGTTENRLFWPKLIHELYIFGVYPVGSVSWDNVVDKTNPTHAGYDPFSATQSYYFTVKEDQTSEANYKASDLMTGLPSGYTHTKGTAYSAPFKLTQYENPGIVPLLFTHRLTKVVVNITKTTGTEDTDIKIDDDIIYTGESDTKYARVTLMNTKRKTTFQVPSTNELVDGVASNVGEVVVGRGSTTITVGGYTAVTLSAIVPPQQIAATTTFIKVELIDNGNVTDTFLYKIPEGGLTLQASRVHTYNIRINKPHINVTTSITNWEDGGTINEIGTLQ
ncbi:MAG: fimbrillin family protein [Bacteroidaceae bacterium]|nr:fimbrillin family protein [Bacteroidaceae bacterium]